MHSAVIKHSWVNLAPAKRLDVPYWIEVSKAITELGFVEPTTDQVKLAMAKVEEKIVVGHAKVRGLRDGAAALLKAARAAEPELPLHVRPRAR